MPRLSRHSKKAPQCTLASDKAQETPTEISIGTDANGGKDGNIPNYTIKPRFLIAGIDD